MAEYREIHTVESDATSNSSALVIFIVAVLALLTVGLILWQPWSTPAVHETTVITQPVDRGPNTTIVNPPSNTTIINPPAEPPKTEPPTTGSTGETGTTGG